MVKRVSALAGHYHPGPLGTAGDVGITLGEIRDLELWQIAAWPETLAAVGTLAVETIGLDDMPGPGQAVTQSGAAVLRIEPLKFWLVGATAPELSADQGAIVDLSHSRTRLRLSGPQAATLLNRHLPLDLRDPSFPVGAVASSAIDHVGVTLWRSQAGYDLFVPRGFALSLWQVLLLGAAQFGAMVMD